MNDNPPHNSAYGKSREKVAAALQAADRPLTAKEVAFKARCSEDAARNALQVLEAGGVAHKHRSLYLHKQPYVWSVHKC